MLYKLKQEEKLDPIINPECLMILINRILTREGAMERDKEHFWCIGLDTRNSVKYCDLVSLGTLNYSLVHPREVFRRAVASGVNAIMVCHNHPSGCTEPSDEDINLTERLVRCGRLLGIELIDHIICGYNAEGALVPTSFKLKGLI